MLHINLDVEPEPVKDFFRALPNDPTGSILELGGKKIAHVVPINSVDHDRLCAAILARRDQSRELNAEWADADTSVMLARSTARRRS